MKEPGEITIKDTKENRFSGKLIYRESKKNFSKFEVTAQLDEVERPERLKDMVRDLLGIYFPSTDYDEISRAINPYGSFINDFKDIIAMTILGAEPNMNFVPMNVNRQMLDFRKLFLFNNLKSAANVFSVLFGTEIKNTVNNANGDKLPTNGLTSLIHNTPMLAAYLTDNDDVNKSYHSTLFQNSFLAPQTTLNGEYTAPMWLSPIARQGVRIGRNVKQVSQLNLSELLELQITYDFLDPLLSRDSIIYLQNAQFADKERQWIVPFILKTVNVFLDGAQLESNIDMRDLIQKVANGDEKSNKILIYI